MEWGQIIGAGISAAGGLLSQGSPADARRGQRHENEIATRRHARNVRIGAERAGFNPLTYLMANGAPAQVGMAQSSSPLASWEAAGDFAGSLYTELSGEAKAADLERSAALQLDKVQGEQARAGGVSGVITRTVHSAAPWSREPLQTASPSLSEAVDGSYTVPVDNLTYVAPGREIDVLRASSGPGLTSLSNRFTGGEIFVPGDDGEPWGVDELATAVVFGVPQLAYNAGKAIGDKVDAWRGDARFNRLMRAQTYADADRTYHGASGGLPVAPWHGAGAMPPLYLETPNF